MTPPPELAIRERIYVPTDPAEEPRESPEPHFWEPAHNIALLHMPWAMQVLGHRPSTAEAIADEVLAVVPCA